MKDMLTDIINAVKANGGISYINDPEQVEWIKSADNRKSLILCGSEPGCRKENGMTSYVSGYVVRTGRSRGELLVHRNSMTIAEVAEFVEKNRINF